MLYPLILNADNIPTQALRSLLSFFKIPESHQKDLASLVAYTQQHWLRNKDRWELPKQAYADEAKYKELLAAVGMLEAIVPTAKKYQAAVILGSDVADVKNRIEYLMYLIDTGCCFKQIILVGSRRSLYSYEYENFKALFGKQLCATTEIEMMQDIFKHLIPAHQSLIVATPVTSERLPNTADTIKTLLSQHPAISSYLFISNQPFCGYQEAVIASLIPAPTSFDIAGPSHYSPTDFNEALIKDTLARWLYIPKNKLT